MAEHIDVERVRAALTQKRVIVLHHFDANTKAVQAFFLLSITVQASELSPSILAWCRSKAAKAQPSTTSSKSPSTVPNWVGDDFVPFTFLLVPQDGAKSLRIAFANNGTFSVTRQKGDKKNQVIEDEEDDDDNDSGQDEVYCISAETVKFQIYPNSYPILILNPDIASLWCGETGMSNDFDAIRRPVMTFSSQVVQMVNLSMSEAGITSFASFVNALSSGRPSNPLAKIVDMDYTTYEEKRDSLLQGLQ